MEFEFEKRVSRDEAKCIDLESEMKKGEATFAIASLEYRFKELESEKLAVEAELRRAKESEEDSLLKINALETEKQLAEKEAECWKSKFEKLVDSVRKLDEIGAFRYGETEIDEDLKLGLELAGIKIESCRDALSKERVGYDQSLGSPFVNTPAQENLVGRGCRDDVSARKILVFEGDGSKSVDVVDLDDSETEEKRDEDCVGEEFEDEDVEIGGGGEGNTNTPLPSRRKRKLVVTSDSESDDDDEDDNIPISSILKKLKPMNQEVDTPRIQENGSGRLRRQHRVSSRQRVSKEVAASSKTKSKQRLTTDDTEDYDDTEAESEGESLDGFIVDDDSHETVSENSEEIREEESDGEGGYADVMSRLRRDNKPKKEKWEYEADMLADFGKDPELCMRAVCVLYRFQTEDEKLTSSSHVSNGRGFSKFDAVRGTRIGEFLTNGNPHGDLKKSVEELKRFESDAVRTCRDLADRYSKQLFEIYNNREDPFFTLPPSP